MRYWDTSAIVPLVVEETATEQVRSWLADDPTIVTWAWTRVEIASAVERRTREGLLSPAVRRSVLGRFGDLAEEWDEVADLVAVRSRALALLARHALRAADAAHLASALLAAEGHPSGLGFVCLDRRLADAADREGLRVVTIDES